MSTDDTIPEQRSAERLAASLGLTLRLGTATESHGTHYASVDVIDGDVITTCNGCGSRHLGEAWREAWREVREEMRYLAVERLPIDAVECADDCRGRRRSVASLARAVEDARSVLRAVDAAHLRAAAEDAAARAALDACRATLPEDQRAVLDALAEVAQ